MIKRKNLTETILLALLLASLSVFGSWGSGYAQEFSRTSSEPRILELTLTEAVFMALRQNRDLESTYMNRVLARYNLRRDLIKFHPNLGVEIGAETTASKENIRYKEDLLEDSRTSIHSPSAYTTTTITQKIPTGAELTFIWDTRASNPRRTTRDGTSRDEPLSTGWSIDLRQPLLKDAGWSYNMASVDIARMNEEDAVRALRDNVIATVTSVIKQYRNLLQEFQRLEMQRSSLDQAREQYELTKILIDTGRRAANDILQTEANVARQELALEGAKSNFDSAQLALLNLLNAGRDITIVPIEQVSFRTVDTDLDECLKIAFERNTTYLRQLNQQKIAQLAVLQAENQKRWDLSANARYGQGWNRDRYAPSTELDRDEWRVGLTLRVPLPIYGQAKYAREGGLLAARIGLRQAKMTILSTEENLENQIRNAVRNVESAHKQVELAQRTRTLSEQSYEISELEYRLGRISSMDHIRNQDKLRDDRENEIRAIVSYENTLTDLDQLLATTLDTWEIDFVPHRKDLEEEFLGRQRRLLGDL